RQTYSFFQERADYEAFKGLPPFIADSLPDSFGNKVINAWLQQQHRDPDSFTPLERLCYTGKRGIGALEFFPTLFKNDKVVEVGVAALVKLADAIFSERKKMHSHIKDKKVIEDIVRVGASAGGARPKALIAYNETTGEIKSGQIAEIPTGFEHWLIKLDGVSKSGGLGLATGMGRVEYAYYLMAVDCGIIMSQCRLLEEGGRAHFMTRRFDRPGNGKKIHAQTLHAMAHLNYNLIDTNYYEQAFYAINRLKLPFPTIEQFYRRMVFNVMAKNCDDHTKNVSFLMDEVGKWSLAPAYDLSYAYDPTGRWNRRHLMGLNGKFEDFTIDDLEKLGREQRIKKWKQIVEQTSEVVSRWSEYAKIVGVPPKIYKPIAKTHEILIIR
ncbi:MAG: type II toxin-antitoxin system HipA family toxin, partial [Bacteroidales bacterium]|nr:type II toxin-antitoxin system HipA family toxin [Bacteroidales bacterium]